VFDFSSLAVGQGLDVIDYGVMRSRDRRSSTK